MFEKIYIEISNICNLKCDFCPAVEREKNIVSLEQFESTLLKIKNQTKRVCLHLMGEPLGHPHFGEIVDICHKHNVFVELTTNGVLVANKKEAIINPAIGQLNISVHSFEANHTKKDIEPYLSKVFELVDEINLKRPDMYVNYRIWDLKDESSLTEKNREIRSRIEAKYNMKFSDLKIDIRRKKGYNLLGRIYVHFDSRFVWPDLKLPEINGSKGFCHALSHHVGIHADGTIVACCLDKEANLAIGNIHQNSIDEALNCPRAIKMKAGFEKKILTEDLCKRCSYIQRF